MKGTGVPIGLGHAIVDDQGDATLAGPLTGQERVDGPGRLGRELRGEPLLERRPVAAHLRVARGDRVRGVARVMDATARRVPDAAPGPTQPERQVVLSK
ncbi:MAG: hypothetical protein U0869_01140 [Chloroflexota bacterium]